MVFNPVQRNSPGNNDPLQPERKLSFEEFLNSYGVTNPLPFELKDLDFVERGLYSNISSIRHVDSLRAFFDPDSADTFSFEPAKTFGFSRGKLHCYVVTRDYALFLQRDMSRQEVQPGSTAIQSFIEEVERYADAIEQSYHDQLFNNKKVVIANTNVDLSIGSQLWIYDTSDTLLTEEPIHEDFVTLVKEEMLEDYLS